jgi:hypothetical protein
MLTLTSRWDSSSVLSDGNKWDFFPALGLGWRIDQEEFFDEVNWVDNLKLRFGVGVTGNSNIVPYSTLGAIQGIFLPFNGMSNVQGYTTNEPYYTRDQVPLANKELGWEKTTQYNVGLEFGLFKNRVSGTLELYRTFTDDLLMEVIIPTLTGYPRTIANVGETSNKGVELSLNVTPIETKSGFIWDSNINVAWQKDQIDNLAYGKNDMVDNSWFIGESINVHYGFENEGLWQDTPEDQAEMALWNANGYNFSPGNVKPKDQNGDYDMTQEDRVVIGNENPNWTLGWNNTFSYKNFDLGVNIISRFGYTADIGGQALTARSNQMETDYWTPNNTGAEFQKPILGQATSGSQDDFSGLLGFRKAAFVKVRNVSLGYNFSKKLCSQIGVENLKVYGQALNPGSLYQSVDWYDFDTNSTIFNRSFAMGLQVGF